MQSLELRTLGAGSPKIVLKMLKTLTNKLELRSRIEIFFNSGTESGAWSGLEVGRLGRRPGDKPVVVGHAGMVQEQPATLLYM